MLPEGVIPFPDTLLKVQLNSLIINKLICKVFPEVCHSFDGNVTCPILHGGVENSNICSNYLDEGSWGEGSCIHTLTHASSAQCCFTEGRPNNVNTLCKKNFSYIKIWQSALWKGSFQSRWRDLKDAKTAGASARKNIIYTVERKKKIYYNRPKTVNVSGRA